MAPEPRSDRLLIPLLLALVVAVVGGVYFVPKLVDRLHGDDGAHPLRYVDPAAIPGTVMDEAAAKELFKSQIGKPSRFAYDPVAWVVLKPDTGKDKVAWPEHPLGYFQHRTNNLGFRELEPTSVQKQGYRALVLGDSHTEGAVNDDESYANVLEELLDQKLDPSGATRPVEVINAGVGGTGPHNYLAMLQKQLVLKPDLVIAGLYVGNDFMNALIHHDFFTKRKLHARDAEYTARLDQALKDYPSLPQQGYNQPYAFKYSPGDDRIALDAAVEVYEAIAKTCDEQGIRFVALVIPCKADVDGEDDGERIRGMLDMLQLSPEDWAVNRRLSDEFVAALRAAGVDCLDPTQAMIDEPAPLYWRKDHHLSVAGHRLVAQLLYDHLHEEVAAAVAAPAAPAAPATR